MRNYRDRGDADVALVKQMMLLVRHRGPDAEGQFISSEGPGVLGHRRLSIMDPEGGNQPIYNESKNIAVIANGEIYNFPSSRLAADYVKVILTGEGADELFGGYGYYKSIENQEFLPQELRRSVTSSHNINLQRVDRMTMAHAIEGRVPFLDLEMIRLGQTIPPEMKIMGSPPIEKWILRKAFEDLLPPEITWRIKEQFDEGSGTVDMLEGALTGIMGEAEVQNYCSKFPETHLRSVEECHYHRLLMEVFENPDIIFLNTGRWSQRPLNDSEKDNVKETG